MKKGSSLFLATALIAFATTSYTRDKLREVSYPATVLDLTNWKLNIPLDEDKDGRSDEIKQPKLATYSIVPGNLIVHRRLL